MRKPLIIIIQHLELKRVSWGAGIVINDKTQTLDKYCQIPRGDDRSNIFPGKRLKNMQIFRPLTFLVLQKVSGHLSNLIFFVKKEK